VKIGLVISEISLLQAIVKKERRKKVTEALHSLPAEAAWRVTDIGLLAYIWLN